MSASEEGGAPWRHVAGGPWLPILRTADEHVREGSHDTNRLISVRDRSRTRSGSRAHENYLLSLLFWRVQEANDETAVRTNT